MGKSESKRYSDFAERAELTDKDGKSKITKKDIQKSKGRKPINSIDQIREIFEDLYREKK